jgi:hypothetical protein
VTPADGARALLLGADSHSEAGMNRPWPLSLPMSQMYVSSVSYVIRNMLQVFYMDIVKVDRDVAYVCKCFRGMLQVFVQNVSSILDICCKRFLYGCCTCFTHTLQEDVRNV